jgi:hypothetical protein
MILVAVVVVLILVESLRTGTIITVLRRRPVAIAILLIA